MKRILLSAAMLAALTASAQNRPVHPIRTYVSTSAQTINTESLQNSDARLGRIVYQGYNTLCLPFSLSAEEFAMAFGAETTVEKAVGAYTENGTFTICFADCTGENLEAGMPYLIHTEKARSLSLSNSTGMTVSQPSSVQLSDNQGNVVTFRGSFERLQPVGTWAIPAVQGEIPADLIKCDGARQLNPTRCFFTWDNQSAASNMVIRHVAAGEYVTGINAAAVTTAEGTVYNLAGQRVNNANGVTIQGGKKVIK